VRGLLMPSHWASGLCDKEGVPPMLRCVGGYVSGFSRSRRRRFKVMFAVVEYNRGNSAELQLRPHVKIERAHVIIDNGGRKILTVCSRCRIETHILEGRSICSKC